MITEARRVPTPASGDINEVWPSMKPGDYCGPMSGYTGDHPAVWFVPPDGGKYPGRRDPGGVGLHHVTSPPHTFRECADGSLEIRASIQCLPSGWHGYLDEGNVWRQV